MTEPKVYDIAIIGAGIVGLATALKLSTKPNLKIIVIDTEKITHYTKQETTAG